MNYYSSFFSGKKAISMFISMIQREMEEKTITFLGYYTLCTICK